MMKYGMKKEEFENLINNGDNSNANLSFSPEMVVEYTYEAVAKEYNLSIMPKQSRKAYLEGFVHHHDLHGAILKPNCLNHNIRFYAKNGLKIDGKGENGAVAKPAKSLEVLLNHLLQAFMAGACVLTGGQAFTNFNTFLAPFARGRSYADIKQAIQGFIFNCNMSLVARGGQVLFSSIGLDLSMPDVLKDIPAIAPDNVIKGTYKDYIEEFNLIFRAVCEVLDEKDGQGAYFRFPNCNGFDNPIIVKHNDILEIKPIGEFVEEMLKNNSIKYNNSFISNVNNYEICSYNPDTDKIEWKRITKAIRNPNQQLYRVTTAKGTYIDVTKEHPFLTMTANKIGNFDGKQLNEFTKYNKLVTSKKQILPYIENKIGTFIGFFLGDGTDLKSTVNNRIGFTLYKKEKCDYLRNLLDELGFIYIERDSTFTMLDVKQENPLCAELIADCVVMKNNHLLAKYNNSKYYLGILVGLINSDGSIHQSKDIDKPSFLLKFSNTNHHLIDLFIRIGNLYGLNVKKGIKQKPQKKNNNLCYDLYCGGYYMNELLNHITLHDIHKNKMFDVDFKHFNRDYGSLSIKNIEAIDYDGFTYDLEVEDNHNYFVGDCNVLSHNCLFSIRNGDLDKYEGNCKLLHELGANNPTIYYVNCTDAERTVMGCVDGSEGIWCKIDNKITYKTFFELSELLKANYGLTPVNIDLKVLTIDDNKKVYWEQVKNFIWNEDRVLYKVLLSDGKSFICDDQHELLTVEGINPINVFDCTDETNLLGLNYYKNDIDFEEMNNYKSVKISSIEKVGYGDSFCIEVNGRMIFGEDFILSAQCRTANQLNYTGDYFRDCLGAGNFMYSTLNLPLIALTYKKDFFKYLDKYIEIIYDTLKWRREQVSNTIYNKHMSDFLLWKDDEEKLYNFDTSSMTIGVCGLYECVKTLEKTDGFVKNIDDFYNDTLGVRIMKFINDKVNEFKERDGLRWGVIGSPAESTAYKFAKINVEKFPDEAIFQGTKNTPYLTNSTHIPVSHESDIVDHIRNADTYHPLTRAGNILHLWLGEVWSDAKSLWKLNQKITGTGTQFWAYSKVFTYCQQCGYTINDNLSECPICKSKDLRVYDRCFSGDTKIFIKKGNIIKPVDLKDFVENYDYKSWKVPVFDSKSQSYVWCNVRRVIKNPAESMIKIEFNKGYSVTCTPSHEFFKYSPTRKSMYQRIKANDLHIKDRVMNHRCPEFFDEGDENVLGTFIGFVLGDGSLTNNKSPLNRYIRIKVYKPEKKDYLKWLLEANNLDYSLHEGYDEKSNSKTYSFGIGANNVGNPAYDIFNKYSDKRDVIKECYNSDLMLGVFAGLINSDGSVVIGRKNQVITTFSQVDRDILYCFYWIAMLLGVNPSLSFTEREGYESVGRIEMSSIKMWELLHKIHLRDPFKTNVENGECRSDAKRINGMCSVKSIKEAPVQESYCIEVEHEDHNSLFNGVLAQNCTGYYLPIKGWNEGKKEEFKDRFRHISI